MHDSIYGVLDEVNELRWGELLTFLDRLSDDLDELEEQHDGQVDLDHVRGHVQHHANLLGPRIEEAVRLEKLVKYLQANPDTGEADSRDLEEATGHLERVQAALLGDLREFVFKCPGAAID